MLAAEAVYFVMTNESPKLIEAAKTEPEKVSEPAKPAEPANTESSKTEPAKPAESSSNLPKSAEEAGRWLVESEKFFRLVAENLRYGSWSKRFAIVGGVAFFALNPGSAGKIGEMVGVKEPPSGYPTAFWLGMGGLGVAAVGTAMLTLPKRKPDDPALMQERQAIKGLRSFELKDAAIFTQLQRQRDVQECFDAVRDQGLRFGVLMGESGCGKSSLLQAGLLPRLRGEAAPLLGVYVKLSDRDPISLIRSELQLEAGSPEEFVPMLAAAVAQAGKPIVLILDQFEQFFVQAKREEDRAGFIRALKAWYDSDVAVKVVVGIRVGLIL